MVMHTAMEDTDIAMKDMAMVTATVGTDIVTVLKENWLQKKEKEQGKSCTKIGMMMTKKKFHL